MSDARRALADHVRKQVRWREIQGEMYPLDERHARSVERLKRLAEYVAELPPSDLRLGAFEPFLVDDTLVIPDHAEWTIRHVGFYASDDNLYNVVSRLAAELQGEPVPGV